ncbi:MAG: glycyl-radical enzyme activating protein [Deltaproteobacteria bacterium]|jgi:pyruvate formate lyase activating enzyme|nr:glycyl-radical enzyme activating protein [Deltaproteobacteria bacterium]
MSKSIQKQTGIVFNIQKYSVHDGPGIRTVVFLSGCPLRCRWCSNPESQKKDPQLAYNRNKCLTFDQCIRCMEVCAAGAIKKGIDNRVDIDREICTTCMLCADVCPPQALKVYGEEKSVAEVVNTVEQDGAFYSRSGGGMTLSGGEPMHQAQFAMAILKEARHRRINTAMETCGYCSTKDLINAGEYLNYLLYDIKVMDNEKHKEVTGVSNERILKNLKAVREAWPKLTILVRTPIIPGVNDNTKAIRSILELITDMPNTRYEILPYHRLGTPKYEYLGCNYPMGEEKLDKTVMNELEAFITNHYTT